MPASVHSWLAEARQAARGQGGFLHSEQVETLVAASGLAREAAQVALLQVAAEFAQPPISQYRVGAVIEGGSGAWYLGTNFEWDASDLAHTIHAEQAAVVNALTHHECEFTRLAVTAAPCGYCRQFLAELSCAKELLIQVEGQPPRTFGELLPQAFGPLDLGHAAGLPLAETRPLAWAGAPPEILGSAAALEAARHAYAPYSRSWAGAAVITTEGRIFAGSYLENAAFNPSLSAVLAAWISLALHGGAPSETATLILVTDADPFGRASSGMAPSGMGIDHLAAAQRLLAQAAPRAQFVALEAVRCPD